jgi:DNA-binding response OmpR family regulator
MPGKKKATILIADDDVQLLDVLALNLELEGYHVLKASDGRQALDLIERYSPDLILLDVVMPRVNGFTICHHVRECSTIPIILITARGQKQDKIRGLDLGADDYLTKPFRVGELLARVRAVLRRSQLTAGELAPIMHATMILGDLSIDFEQRQVMMAGRKVTLTPIEYRILACLGQHAGRIVFQECLLERVWGAAYADDSHLLQVNINRLRRKLEPDPASPRYILTEPGVGYLLTTPTEGQGN